MSLLIKFDKTPTWHLPWLPEHSIQKKQKKNRIFGTGVVDACIERRIKRCTNGRAVQKDEDKNK